MTLSAFFPRVDARLVRDAAELPSSILSDVTGRHCALHGRVQPLRPGMRVAGPAFTVAVRPGDNLAIHLALLLAQPGDVLVVDGQGDLRCALMGELMCAHAAKAGLAGVVVDGAVRDSAELRAGALPVFASGTNPNGPTRSLAGRIAVPVSVGGVSVAPGDLIVGDDDGLVALAAALVPEAIRLGRAKLGSEDQRRTDIAENRLVYGWLEQALRGSGMLQGYDSLQAAMDAFAPR